MVQVPEVPEGIWLASDSGTVHALDVPSPLPIVPVAEPNLYVKVCVKALAARGILMVMLAPMFTLEADTVGVVALGMVLKTPLPEAVMSP